MPASRVSTFFDRYAHDFGAIYGNDNGPINSIVNKLFRRSMALRYQKTLEGCDPIEGRSVLDVGCGPGHYSVALAGRGAGRVLGIDFADGMLQVARDAAKRASVDQICQYQKSDFLLSKFDEKFDYVIVMGFMDYIAEPSALIRKILCVTEDRAFFSFPVHDGLLAWQRQLRYRARCDLYLYTANQVRDLFADTSCKNVSIGRIGRDLFVTADMKRG